MNYRMVSNAREAINMAKDVIEEAGYMTSRILEAEYDEDDKVWRVRALSVQSEIELTITEDGDVEDFSTD